MSYDKLEGEAKLNYRKLDNGTTEFNVYDDNHFICGSLGCNKAKLEEMIQRSNEYRRMLELINSVEVDDSDDDKCSCCITASQERAIENMKAAMYDQIKEIEKLSARNRELAESINEFKVVFTELIGVYDIGGVYKEHLQYHIDRAEKILREVKEIE